MKDNIDGEDKRVVLEEIMAAQALNEFCKHYHNVVVGTNWQPSSEYVEP